MSSNLNSKPPAGLAKYLSRVVWSEGMYLGSHHFQVQRQSFEDTIQFLSSNLWFAAYGLISYSLDGDALRNGTIALSHARGIFPDGLVFDMPESDPLPPSLPVRDAFLPTQESMLVLLCVPLYYPGGANCALAQGNTRYVSEAHALADENSGGDARSVQLGRKNIQFVFDGAALETFSSIPIARIIRDGSGNYVYDPSFIPPCVQIGASERLLMILRRLIEILDEKSATLSPFGRGASKFQAGFSSSEVASFWFAHTVNSSLGILRHLYQTERGHPEQVYAEMARLAGALCTFGMDSHPQSLPSYDHVHLDRCFRALDEHIRAHLELVVPTNCVVVPLNPSGRYTFVGEIQDQRCVGRARWILAMQSDAGELDIISRVPRQVKMCSSELLPELVKTSLPGLGLTHLPIPPSAVAPKVEYQYFGVSRSGSAWEDIVRSRKVGLYVPGDFPNPQVELFVILES